MLLLIGGDEVALDYRLENLGDERFQHLCQALILKDYPHAQCIPTGQADGGRDVLISNVRRRRSVVFQCKYVTRPDQVADVFQFVTRLLQGELPKIRKLVERGLERYYFVTNLTGSAALNRGTIDRVAGWLQDTLPIEAACWWRNDVNRRLDATQDVRWAYPEILSGLDLIGLIATNLVNNQDRDRTQDAIRAYVRRQLDDEKYVRFRQVDLRRDLFDLFVDAPLVISPKPNNVRDWRRIAMHEQRIQASVRLASTGAVRTTAAGLRGHSSGGASVLLHPDTARLFPTIVVEGAPGQGKSTLVQFVCQVHRYRLIFGNEQVHETVAPYGTAPIRIPFKVDLRDFALWAARRNPFTPGGGEELSLDTVVSLETFLATQVHHESGGARFDVADLHSVLRSSPTLVVLDGLDEVADVNIRRLVVDQITTSVGRLREIAQDLQVIVTSRPSVYANSPGFGRDDFRYCEILALTNSLIHEYANRWAAARSLPTSEQTELLRVLEEKRREPHIGELARNPMQLAILLNLINNYGSSLPDKRTAIYDNYVQLFLNRESDKSNVVRTYRDLLVDIHRYVAWQLQLQAESGQGRGSIERQQLLDLLEGYLKKEQRDPGLAHVLFQGMLERVFALVQRVEGSYEFEVQPVREYFCAKYLYETAPESPVGREQTGTVIERFDTLARNNYWLNVTRFFAGSFKKGQLAALAQTLEAICSDPYHARLAQPMRLGVYLLRDWVFTQDRASVANVAKLISQPLGLCMAFTDPGSPSDGVTIVLPPDSGREELVAACKSILGREVPTGYALQVASVLGSHSDSDELLDWWRDRARGLRGRRLTRWLRIGCELDLCRRLSEAEAEALLTEEQDRRVRTRLLFQYGHWKLFMRSGRAVADVIDELLDGAELYPDVTHGPIASEMARLAAFVYIAPHFPMYEGLLVDTVESDGEDREEELSSDVAVYLQQLRASAAILKDMEGPGRRRDVKATFTDALEGLRRQWGDRLALWRVACQLIDADPGREGNPNGSRVPDLYDREVPLAPRVLAARKHRADVRWWRRQLQHVNATNDIRVIAMLLLLFGTGEVILQIIGPLDRRRREIAPPPAVGIASIVRQLFTAPFGVRPMDRVDVFRLPSRLSTEIQLSIGFSQGGEVALAIYQRYLSDYRGSDDMAIDYAIACEIALASRSPDRWRGAVQRVRSLYGRSYGESIRRFRLLEGLERRGRYVMPFAVAREVSVNADLFPHALVDMAQDRLLGSMQRRIEKVGRVAERQGW